MVVPLLCPNRQAGVAPGTTDSQGIIVMTDTDRVELTDAIVRAAKLPRGKLDYLLRDTKQPGYALRLRARHAMAKAITKSLYFLTTRPGIKGTHKVPIGAWPRIKVVPGRRIAAGLAGQRAHGVDVVAAHGEKKRKAIAAARAAAKAKSAALGVLLEEDGPFEKHLKATGYVNWQSVVSSLRRHLLPAHKLANVRDITRSDIVEAMDALDEAGKPGASDDLRKFAYKLLEWTASKGYCGSNVMAGYRKSKKTRAEKLALLGNTKRKSKKRALTDEEIGKVWHASFDFGVFGCLIRTIMLGGPRRSEPAVMTWSENVLPDRITFAAEITKMGRIHAVPRTALINSVLDDAKRYSRTGQWVFPSPQKADAPIVAFDPLERLIGCAGVAHFTPHDLRRTVRTIMSQCGYDDAIQRAAIGQASPSLDQVYNMDEKWALRKMAFEACHDYMRACIEGRDTAAVVKRQRANNLQNAMKLKLLARLVALHAEAAE
jgi:integrase